MLTPGSLAEAMAAATNREWVEGPEFDAGLARAQAVEKLTKSARFLLEVVLGCLGNVKLHSSEEEEAEINAAADAIRAAEEWKP